MKKVFSAMYSFFCLGLEVSCEKEKRGDLDKNTARIYSSLKESKEV